MFYTITSLIRNLFYQNINPEDFPECLDCGACCGFFKGYFKEEKNPDYKKLGDRIHFVSKDKIYLKGMEVFRKGRCDSLDGEIGKYVSCSVYEDRPNICRDYQRVLPNGKINPRCVQARLDKGLPIKLIKSKIDL